MTPPRSASISDDVVVEHAVYDASSSLIIDFVVVYLHVTTVVNVFVSAFGVVGCCLRCYLIVSSERKNEM